MARKIGLSDYLYELETYVDGNTTLEAAVISINEGKVTLRPEIRFGGRTIWKGQIAEVEAGGSMSLNHFEMTDTYQLLSEPIDLGEHYEQDN